MSLELSPHGRFACTEAVRWQIGELQGASGDPAKLRARRASVDLLHFALEGHWEIDRFQMRQLRSLLEHREEYLRARPLPFWPGARYAASEAVMEELCGSHEAVEQLNRLLAADA